MGDVINRADTMFWGRQSGKSAVLWRGVNAALDRGERVAVCTPEGTTIYERFQGKNLKLDVLTSMKERGK